jgi:hypothetical protein
MKIIITERQSKLLRRIINEESSPTGDSTPQLKEVALHYMKKAGIPSGCYLDGSAVPTEEGFRYVFRIWKDSYKFKDQFDGDTGHPIMSEIELASENLDELTSILKDRIEGDEFANIDDGPGRRYVRTELIYMGETNNDYEFMVEVEEGYNEREENNMSDTVSERYFRNKKRY